MSVNATKQLVAAVGVIILLYIVNFHTRSYIKEEPSVSVRNPRCPNSDAGPVHFPVSRAHRLANVVDGPGFDEWHDDSVKEATCKFKKNKRDAAHLPHTMQQLYRCFSWWHANPKKKAVLLNPPRELQTPFVVGFLDLLETHFHVTLTNEREGRKSVVARVNYTFDGLSFEGGYKMRSPGDFDMMHEKGLSKLGVTPKAGCPAAGPPTPRITILNREQSSGRYMEDAIELKTLLEKELDVAVNLVSSMDGKDFTEQVQLMADTDILISPHGAQLTSMPFLPKCAHVYEIFPMGYLTPKFYGSLAASRALNYNYIYPGVSIEQEGEMQTEESRKAARAQNICLSSDALKEKIAPGIVEGVKGWKQCCGHHS